MTYTTKFQSSSGSCRLVEFSDAQSQLKWPVRIVVAICYVVLCLGVRLGGLGEVVVRSPIKIDKDPPFIYVLGAEDLFVSFIRPTEWVVDKLI